MAGLDPEIKPGHDSRAKIHQSFQSFSASGNIGVIKCKRTVADVAAWPSAMSARNLSRGRRRLRRAMPSLFAVSVLFSNVLIAIGDSQQ